MEKKTSLQGQMMERVGPLTLQLPSMAVEALGTCFIIGAMGGSAIAITAAHCLSEAENHDVPNRVPSAPGSPFQVERPTRNWNRIELGTVIKHRELPFFMSLPLEVQEAYAHSDSDVAFMLLQASEEYRESIKLDRAIALCSAGPVLNEKVLVVGFFKTEAQASHHIASGGRAAFTSVSGKFQMVEATVTGIFLDGIRDMRWPCFQLDCPLHSGMSGGCVLVHRGNNFYAAGMISRDMSYEAEASGDQAFAAHIGPALSIAFPEKKYSREGEATVTTLRSIRDLVAIGVIEDISNPISP